MKKVNIYTTILALMLVLAMGSCKKDPVIGGTATQALAGEWWVHFGPGDADYSSSTYFNLSTYNTAANIPTEMWFDDDNDAQSFWDVKGKVSCNVSNLTFSVASSYEYYYGVQVTITGGKIMRNAATAPVSKDKTDSIYFKATFTGDPTVYTYSGYKRTGFAGDDPQ